MILAEHNLSFFTPVDEQTLITNTEKSPPGETADARDQCIPDQQLTQPLTTDEDSTPSKRRRGNDPSVVHHRQPNLLTEGEILTTIVQIDCSTLNINTCKLVRHEI